MKLDDVGEGVGMLRMIREGHVMDDNGKKGGLQKKSTVFAATLFVSSALSPSKTRSSGPFSTRRGHGDFL